MKQTGYVVDVTVDAAEAEAMQQLALHWQQLQPEAAALLPDVVQVHVPTGTGAEAEALQWLRDNMGAQVSDMTPDQLAPVLVTFGARVDVLPADKLQLRVAVGSSTHTLTPRCVSVQVRGAPRLGEASRTLHTRHVFSTPAKLKPPPADLLAKLRQINLLRHATQEQLQELVERAAVLDRPRVKTAPTAMLDVVTSVVTTSNKAEQRKVRLEDGTMPKVTARMSRNGMTKLGHTVQLQLQRGAQLYFDLDPTPALPIDAPADEVARAVLNQLCSSFSANMVRTFVSLLVSRAADGTVLENYAQLAELRGWSADSLRSSHGARKKQLQRDVLELLKVRVVLKGAGQTVDMPLLLTVATVSNDDAQRKSRRWLQINPKIAAPLEAKGLVAAFDTRLLRIESDAALLIGLYLARRAAASWTTQRLDHSHGRMRHKVTTILEGAGIDWEARLRKLGLKACRQWIEDQLRELQATTQGAGPALWYQYVNGTDLNGDMLETWQGSHLVAEQNSWTTKRRGKRDRAALPPPDAGTLPQKPAQTPPEA